MIATGIVRRVDELGRVVIPIELRRTLNIHEKDPIEIFVDDDKVILKKYITDDSCIFCSSTDIHSTYRGRNICFDCIKKLPKK